MCCLVKKPRQLFDECMLDSVTGEKEQVPEPVK